MYVAIVSTTVATADPLRELAPGLALLGEITERFDSVSDTFKPTGDGAFGLAFGEKERRGRDGRRMIWIREEDKGGVGAVNVYRINTLGCVLQVRVVVLSCLLLVYCLLT